MPQYRLDNALDQIATYVTDIGDIVAEAHVDDLLRFTKGRDEQYRLRGHRCEFNGFTYYVAGHPELRFAVVAYQYDIHAGLAEELDDAAVEALTDGSEDDPDKDREMAAVERLFERADRKELSDLWYRLGRLSAGSETAVDLTGQAPAETRHVFVSEQLFPYEQRFSVERFAACRSRLGSLSETVQAAVERAISTEQDDTGVPNLVIDMDRI